MMTNTATQITDLMTGPSKTAPEMTHALKTIGNGSMQRGFSVMGEFFAEAIAEAFAKGLSKGRIQGGLIGAIGASGIAATSFIVSKRVQKKNQKIRHEEKGQRILRAMEGASLVQDNLTEEPSQMEDLDRPDTLDKADLGVKD